MAVFSPWKSPGCRHLGFSLSPGLAGDPPSCEPGIPYAPNPYLHIQNKTLTSGCQSFSPYLTFFKCCFLKCFSTIFSELRVCQLSQTLGLDPLYICGHILFPWAFLSNPGRKVVLRA